MKKISFFSALPPFRGGISHFSEILSTSLSKKSKLSKFTFKKQYPSFLFPGKTQYISNYNANNAAQRIVSTFNPLSYFKAYKEINKSEPEVFICNYWMSFFGPMMGFIARRLSKKTIKIGLIHNLTPHEKRFFDKPFNKYFINSYDGFIALSEFVLEDIKKLNPNKPCIVIPHPPYNNFNLKINQLEAQNKLALNSTKKTILFFGIIRDYKGLDLLIDAFNLLDDSYQLIIAGEVYGDDGSYDKLINKNTNSQRIYFFNQYIPDEEVHLYFSASDCIVLPYKSGTQSGVAAIAEQFDLPVLTSNVGGISEKINHGVNGLIFKDTSAQNISDQIKECYKLKLPETIIDNRDISNAKKVNEWDLFAEEALNFASSLKS